MKHKSSAAIGNAITIKFHDESRSEFYITEQTRAVEVTQLVAEELELPDVYDFKVFENEDGKMRPVMDDELVLQLTKKFFKKKSLLFRKYLFLPDCFDSEQ